MAAAETAPVTGSARVNLEEQAREALSPRNGGVDPIGGTLHEITDKLAYPDLTFRDFVPSRSASR